MPLDWARVKAICFDVDGTLSDTDNHMVASLLRSMQKLSWLIPENEQKHFARGAVMAMESPGNFLYHLADRIGFDRSMINLSDWMSRHAFKRMRTHFWIIPGVKKLLDVLRPRYRLSIVSARNRIGTEAFLEQFSLTEYFQAVASSQTCRHTKPFPDPVFWVAAQMGVEPEYCLMVGDTVVDIKAGRAAGAQTAGVLCGFGTRRELERAGADVIYSTTSDLMPGVNGPVNH